MLKVYMEAYVAGLILQNYAESADEPDDLDKFLYPYEEAMRRGIEARFPWAGTVKITRRIIRAPNLHSG